MIKIFLPLSLVKPYLLNIQLTCTIVLNIEFEGKEKLKMILMINLNRSSNCQIISRVKRDKAVLQVLKRLTNLVKIADLLTAVQTVD